MQSKFIKIKGDYNIHYLESGDSENTLVLLHGLPTNSSLYKEIISPLSKKFKVIAPDFIGFGKSDKPINFSYDLKSYTDILKNFLNALGISKCSIVAMDLGLLVAINFALNNNKYINSLILFEGFILPVDRSINNMRFWQRFSLLLMKNKKIAQDILEKNSKKSAKSFIKSGLIKNIDAELLEEFSSQFESRELSKKLWLEGIGMHQITTNRELALLIQGNFEKLKKSGISLCILYGNPGQVITNSTLRELNIEFPNAIFAKVGKGKHFLPLECPEELSIQIINFLKK